VVYVPLCCRCDTWIKAEQKWTCKSRLEKIKEKKMNWYMNEVGLYIE
jgi:hypothetical protein